MKHHRICAHMFLALSLPLTVAAVQAQGTGRAIITVLPRHGGEAAPNVNAQDISVKANGKAAQVTGWSALNRASDKLELVVLIDDSARTSLGTQITEIADFIKAVPPNTSVGVAYMQNGRAVFVAPLSSDLNRVAGALHLPASSGGASASPYFSLSDLAKNWPSQDDHARREVVMISDGVDPYQLRFDPEDPYVKAAMTDAARARLVVYSLYWVSRGRVNATQYESYAGQNLLKEVTDSTGGKSYWQGEGNPVSFRPFFEEKTSRADCAISMSSVSRCRSMASRKWLDSSSSWSPLQARSMHHNKCWWEQVTDDSRQVGK